jgi:hypothetical protein
MNPSLALTYHQQALDLATNLGSLADQARAHDGLAQAHHTLKQPAQARVHWHRALEILTSLGTDNTEDLEASGSSIRAHLANLDPSNNHRPQWARALTRRLHRPR